MSIRGEKKKMYAEEGDVQRVVSHM